MKRVLVTGAGGFIGRHVLARLAAQGYLVHGVSSRPRVEVDGVAWHHANLLDTAQITELTSRVRATHLLHLAWITKPGEYWESGENVRWLESGLALLRGFAESGGMRAVFAGTCAEYDGRFGYCREFVTPCRPASLYGQCKDALRRISEGYGARAGLSVAWGRVFFLYGPGEQPERLVPYVIRRLLRGESAHCSSGDQVRDFMHVADAAAAFGALLESGATGAVNIASGVPVTVGKVATQIGSMLGRPELVQLGVRVGAVEDVPVLLGDATRLRKEVGWVAQHTLETGLADTIGWWKSRGKGAPH
jgi:nucleoside-diphosphate-sugar epimerase